MSSPHTHSSTLTRAESASEGSAVGAEAEADDGTGWLVIAGDATGPKPAHESPAEIPCMRKNPVSTAKSRAKRNRGRGRVRRGDIQPRLAERTTTTADQTVKTPAKTGKEEP
jgi:hypothetical protein